MPNASCNSQGDVPRCQGAVGNQWNWASVKGKGALCAAASIFQEVWILNGNGKTLMAKLKHVPWTTSFLYYQKDRRPYREENWVPNSLLPVKKLWAGKTAGATCKIVLVFVRNTHSFGRLQLFLRQWLPEGSVSPFFPLPQTLIKGVGLQQ